MKIQLPEQIIESVQRDLLLYESYLYKIASEVLNKEISKYPIFVAHRESNLSLGKLVIDREQHMTDWSINASLLEELVAKRIISVQKIVNFKEVYKSPFEYACLFIISGDSDAGFAFYPYRKTFANTDTTNDDDVAFMDNEIEQ